MDNRDVPGGDTGRCPKTLAITLTGIAASVAGQMPHCPGGDALAAGFDVLTALVWALETGCAPDLARAVDEWLVAQRVETTAATPRLHPDGGRHDG